MKIFKTFLHVWITIVSLFSFLAGWAMLAHSRKPVQPNSSSSANFTLLPALEPIQNSGTNNGNSSSTGLFSINPLPRSRSSILGTSGS